MKLSTIGEFGLIHAIQQLSPGRSPGTMTGIGDDAAVLKIGPAKLLLATTDMLVEDVHFDLSYTDFYSLGWKSASVNLSDIAAMGGVPRFCLTALALPARISVRAVTDFYEGFNALLRIHKTVLVGGDTCASGGGLVISVTALGEATKRTLITRKGAKKGDRIFVTGTLGDSGAGMELLKAGFGVQGSGVRGKDHKSAMVRPMLTIMSGSRMIRNGSTYAHHHERESNDPQSAMRTLIERHLRPVPRVEWGRRIARSGCASSMIDVSDGLSSDLTHLCEESGTGALLFGDRIPFSPALLRSVDQLRNPPLDYALSGGEDYELLFTVPLTRMKALAALRIPVTEIGVITTGRAMLQVNAGGKKIPLRPTGYNHFKGNRNCAKRSI